MKINNIVILGDKTVELSFDIVFEDERGKIHVRIQNRAFREDVFEAVVGMLEKPFQVDDISAAKTTLQKALRIGQWKKSPFRHCAFVS